MDDASPPPEEEVAEAAGRRATALAERDEAALRLLMHPKLQWTTLRGEVLGCEAYITGNTRGDLRWRSQRLDDVKVTVVADTAVLTAAISDEVSWRCLAGHASLPAAVPG